MYLDNFTVLRAISEFIKYLAFSENLAIYQIFRLGRSTLKSQIQPVIQLFRVISPKLLDSKFGRIYSEYPNDKFYLMSEPQLEFSYNYGAKKKKC